ncbi:transposase [Rubinisphaera margarita]|uniref:transposase n=1 Tax=Rubinisphaera margarita TaxID=2909586 RepID=UPI001EE8E5AC|nr:transposase [Rubinisphaera margarita]MCG6157551.1 transposase [Rubinisphaera margarita]
MSRRKSYPSDITNARWQLISPLVEESQSRGRRRSTDLREVINAINYRWSTGCTWRMLPHDFPAWETCYTYFDRWRKQGQLWRIREILLRRSPYVPLDPKQDPREGDRVRDRSGKRRTQKPWQPADSSPHAGASRPRDGEARGVQPCRPDLKVSQRDRGPKAGAVSDKSAFPSTGSRRVPD